MASEPANPQASDRRFAEAVRAYRQGELARAAELCRAITARQPGFARAHDLLGMVRAAEGKTADALKHVRKAARKAPDDPAILNDLGMLLVAAGEARQAVGELRRALARKCDFAAAWLNLGNAQAELGDLAAALKAYRTVTEIQPGHAEAHNNAGNCLFLLEHYEAARQAFERALARAPGNTNFRMNKAAALVALGEVEPGREIAEALVAARPGFAQAQNILGNAALQQGDLEASMAAYRAAIDAAPGYAEAHANLGKALSAAGRPEEAEAPVREALRLSPDYPNALTVLPDLRRVAPGEADHAALLRLADQADSLSPTDAARVNYALGDIHERAGEIETAFAHYSAGAQARRRNTDYSFDAHEKPQFDQLRGHVTAAAVAAHRAARPGRSDPRPVFIVGMPRSGTSLVEQILASHPQVFGAGERRELRRAVNDQLQKVSDTPPGFDRFADLAPAQLTAIADGYLAALDGLEPGGALRITDKMPQNFLLVPFIRLALPEAQIVHVRRDPRATGWSCFKQLFVQRLYWTYDLEEIGAFYRHYADLMAQWRDLFPGEFLELDYESLVADPETEARRLVDYTGLDWDPACLRFYESDRPVMTASLHQVRQPIYRSALTGWQRFAAHLAPLHAALGPHGASE